MPFGAVTQKLGISNARVKNAASFAQTVLRLPVGTPVFQQQLVHSNKYRHGPTAEAAWCDIADNEAGNSCTIRQISAHNTQFARINISDSPYFNFLDHYQLEHTNQIYYVGNEPETGSNLSPTQPPPWPEPPPQICSCWDPINRDIDSQFQCISPNQFWEPISLCPGCTLDCGVGAYSRIYAEVLAYVYLRLRDQAQGANRGHIVLPPVSHHTQLGSNSGNLFEITFFDRIHNGGFNLGGCPSVQTISPEEMKTLHIHRYSENPITNTAITSPLFSVAYDAFLIRDGVQWYRNTHAANPLPADILLSEFGYAWELDLNVGIPPQPQPKIWAGGWDNFRLGLSWWNSYLCWVTRLAPFECNLENWQTGVHDVHACIHIPETPPYTAHSLNLKGAIGIQRNQYYLNVNSLEVNLLINKNALQITQLTVDPPLYQGAMTYENSFLKFQNQISWDGKVWWSTPFGVCYSVWAQIGKDPYPAANLSVGWVDATSSDANKTPISLPEGFSTVYFSVIKKPGYFDPSQSPRIDFRWFDALGRSKYHGKMALNDFQDTSTFSEIDPNYDTYAAMIYPVVCYSHPNSQLTVELLSNFSGPGVILGRPIVLPGICSWFTDQ